MCATTLLKNYAMPAVIVAIGVSSIFSSARDTAAFQVKRGASQGGYETCAFTLQMNDPHFRQRYLKKVARLQKGAAADATDVERMYRSTTEVSLLWGYRESAEAQSNRGVDPLSQDCLGCHDGSAASDIPIDLRNNPYGRSMIGLSRGTDSEHPIGMEYALYAGNGNDYKPLFGGESKMILVNGRVGCLTCHDPLNEEKGHLAVSDRNSGLCLTCHNK